MQHKGRVNVFRIANWKFLKLTAVQIFFFQSQKGRLVIDKCVWVGRSCHTHRKYHSLSCVIQYTYCMYYSECITVSSVVVTMLGTFIASGDIFRFYPVIQHCWRTRAFYFIHRQWFPKLCASPWAERSKYPINIYSLDQRFPTRGTRTTGSSGIYLVVGRVECQVCPNNPWNSKYRWYRLKNRK